MIKSVEPVITAPLLPEIHKKLVALLKNLSKSDWQKPTVCASWTVKEVALHLLGVEVGNLSRRRDGHVLNASVNNWGELVDFVNDWNQNWVSAANRISPPLLIDLLALVGSQMCDFFQELDPYAMGDAVVWAGPEPAPVWLDIAREYTERWHHQQHIREAVGIPDLKQPKYFSPVLDSFVRALPRTYFETNADENTAVTLTITGASGGRWSIIRKNLTWTLYSGAPAESNAEVIIDQDIAWRLFTRGIEQNKVREQIIVNGDQSLGIKLLDMVSIIA